MEMYDTEVQRTELRRQQERLVRAWMRAAAYAEGSAAAEPFAVVRDRPSSELDLRRAVDAGKRDNFALGQALISIGLIGRGAPEPETAREESDELARSLMHASSIRSRLGEILLKAKRITSGQLEFALELQRHQGGLLGEILISLGWLEREVLEAALAAQASGKRAA